MKNIDKIIVIVAVVFLFSCENGNGVNSSKLKSGVQNNVIAETEKITEVIDESRSPAEITPVIDIETDINNAQIFSFDDFEPEPLPEDNTSDMTELDCGYKGNRVSNPSFEEFDDRKGIVRKRSLSQLFSRRGWDVFDSLPSGSVLGENSWTLVEGSGIEVQSNGIVKKSPYGKFVLELDSHGANSNSAISQEVMLCAGTYEVSFLYYARSRRDNDNGILLSIGDTEVSEANLTFSGHWMMVKQEVKINRKDKYDLTVKATGIENTLGGLIDNIVIKRK